MSNLVTRAVIEVTRQVGTGVREYLRDRRRKEQSKRPPADTALVRTLVAMGFSKEQAAIASRSTRPSDSLQDQVRDALKVITP